MLTIRNSTHLLTNHLRQTSPDCHPVQRQSLNGTMSTVCYSVPQRLRYWLQAHVHKSPSSTMQLQIQLLFSSPALVSLARILFAFLVSLYIDLWLTYCNRATTIYTVSQKECCRTLAITLSNLGQFSKFFQCWKGN